MDLVDWLPHREALSLLTALLALVISLASQRTARKVAASNAEFQTRQEQRTYKASVREFLLLSTQFELVLRSLEPRANRCRSEATAVFRLLAASNRPSEYKELEIQKLANIDTILASAVRKFQETFAPFLKSAKETTDVVLALIGAGAPIPPKVHDQIMKGCSVLERITPRLNKEANEAFQPCEKHLQLCRDRLSSDGEGTRQ